MHRPAASVVIPTWNGAHLLPTCLEALRGQAPAFEVIVVDNGSSDGTSAVLDRYGEVRRMGFDRNRGFAAAANEGVRAARSDAIVLLNNDTEVAPGWLEALLEALRSESGVGMAASKVRLFDRREVLHTTGDTVDLAGFAANRGVWQVDAGQWDGAREVFGANGAAAAYRRELFRDVGGFEEAFGSYMEDVDLAWRARLAGWRCVFAPEAVVYHRLSATGGGPLASYLVARNRVWLIARNYPCGLLRRHWRRVAASQLGELQRAVAHARGAAARATVRGLVVGWATWPRMLSARRRILSARRIDDRQLEALLRAVAVPGAAGAAPGEGSGRREGARA